eukprot:364796-Chlamydomonas_euryale.AAC.5
MRLGGRADLRANAVGVSRGLPAVGRRVMRGNGSGLESERGFWVRTRARNVLRARCRTTAAMATVAVANGSRVAPVLTPARPSRRTLRNLGLNCLAR